MLLSCGLWPEGQALCLGQLVCGDMAASVGSLVSADPSPRPLLGVPFWGVIVWEGVNLIFAPCLREGETQPIVGLRLLKRESALDRLPLGGYPLFIEELERGLIFASPGLWDPPLVLTPAGGLPCGALRTSLPGMSSLRQQGW